MSRLVLDGPNASTALLRTAGPRREATQFAVPDGGDVVVQSYDSRGTLRQETTTGGTDTSISVLAAGFTIVTPAPAD